ncbi:MAG: anti-sigma factor family protein [Anaerolineaceae bacterium]
MSEHVHTEKCSTMLGDLSDYIDGNLQAEICAQIEEHMKTCDNCRVVVDTLRKTIELYEHCSDNMELPGEVKERLFAKLEIKDYLSTVDSPK